MKKPGVRWNGKAWYKGISKIVLKVLTPTELKELRQGVAAISIPSKDDSDYKAKLIESKNIKRKYVLDYLVTKVGEFF